MKTNNIKKLGDWGAIAIVLYSVVRAFDAYMNDVPVGYAVFHPFTSRADLQQIVNQTNAININKAGNPNSVFNPLK